MPIIQPQLVKYYIEEDKPSIIFLTTFICSNYKEVWSECTGASVTVIRHDCQDDIRIVLNLPD